MLGAIDNERQPLHCEPPSQSSRAAALASVSSAGDKDPNERKRRRRYTTAERMNVTMESNEEPG